MTTGSHKDLGKAFSAPRRGQRLGGLLNPAQGAAPPQPTDPAESSVPVQDPPAPEQTGGPAVGGGASPTRTPTRVKPQKSAGDGGPTSVYLRPRAYSGLVERRQKRFRTYAQTVYDAFAYIRDVARDDEKDPSAVLAELFESDAGDPWLMPEPQAAKNTGEALVEAKISFKAHERKWVMERMAETPETKISPFLSRVLEFYLVEGPARRKTK